MRIMSSLLVVVKSHLFPQFVHLNREIGTSRGHRGDGDFAAVSQSRVGVHGTRELHIGGTAAFNRDGQRIHWKRGAAAVTHKSGSCSFSYVISLGAQRAPCLSVCHFGSRGGPRATCKRKPVHLKFKGNMRWPYGYIANASLAITTFVFTVKIALAKRQHPALSRFPLWLTQTLQNRRTALQRQPPLVCVALLYRI